MSQILKVKPKELPAEFNDAVADLRTYLEKIPTKVRRVIKLGEKYGIDQKLVKGIIKGALEGVISERSINRYCQEVNRPKQKPKQELDKMADIDDNNQTEEISLTVCLCSICGSQIHCDNCQSNH